MAQIILVEFLFPCYLAILPLYQMLLSGEEFTSSESLGRAKEFLFEFVANGMLADPSEAKR